jgi:hypothetical protein
MGQNASVKNNLWMWHILVGKEKVELNKRDHLIQTEMYLFTEV